jgi:predicted 3-demethylubiquinone-9 3-methyltransferase (glyoxalase superfamily)
MLFINEFHLALRQPPHCGSLTAAYGVSWQIILRASAEMPDDKDADQSTRMKQGVAGTSSSVSRC